MKGKILVIADLGHASPRIPGIFTELSQFGWEIDIYSPRMSRNQKNIFGLNNLNKLKNIKIIESRSKMWYKRDYSEKFPKKIAIKLRRKALNTILVKKTIKKLIQYGKNNFVEIDHLFWTKNSRKELKKIVSGNNYNFVFSSSSPIATHIIAKEISTQFKIKWIADLRDLWSYNHTNIVKASSRQLRFEKQLFSTANQLTTVSKQLARIQKKIYKGNIDVIYNGFTSTNKKEIRKSNSMISIVYTGVLETGFHDFEILLDKIDIIEKYTKNHIEFIFAGSCCPIISEYFKNNNQNVPKCIKLMGNISRNSAHQLQRDADALLLFGWKDRNTTGLLQTKLFEYLSTKKPILLIGGTGDLEAREILNRTRTGFYFSNINKFISELQSFSKNKEIKIKPNNKAIEFYSYSSQAKRLEILFNKVGKS